MWSLHVGQPAWLVAAVLVVPVWTLGRRSLAALSPLRLHLALVLRSLTILILVALLARLVRIERADRLTVVAVLDRSQSIPTLKPSLDFLTQAVARKSPLDQLAVVDVAETAAIAALADAEAQIPQRNTTLTGAQSALADGIQMAVAIAPPNTAVRIVLTSDGNQNVGDLKEAARTAAVNHIPIDVLPVRYHYDHEVILRRLVVPGRARKGQTLPVRFVLASTVETRGQLRLLVNGEAVDLDPQGPQTTAQVTLRPGINVQTLSLPVTTSGVHHWEALFVPDDPGQDRVAQNNRAAAVTFVAGPGHVLIVDADGTAAGPLRQALAGIDMDVREVQAAQFPETLSDLMDVDAVVLVDTDCSALTFEQHRLLARYVTDLGGGLIMIGGPHSFGAGGWIGSPVAEILPVDLDPPQKKQMPRGALVLVIDRSGSMTGLKLELCKVAAGAAVRLLSRLDLVGVVVFEAESGWLVPLGPAENKDRIAQAIRGIGAGGGTVMGPAMGLALEALHGVQGGIRHVILLTDGQTTDRDLCARLGAEAAADKITVSTVAIGPDADGTLLRDIAASTQGRFYSVADPTRIPEIFIKEAQVVRRSMIVERTFSPQVVHPLSEVLKGLSPPLPSLDGYVLTGPKGGLNQVVLASDEADPILATCQAGLGRCVAFTGAVDGRWSAAWLGWSQHAVLWEQALRWVARSATPDDWDVLADVQGRQVQVHVEAASGQEGGSPLADVQAQVIGPDLVPRAMTLDPTGPGQFDGRFEAGPSGSYIVGLRYRKGPDGQVRQSQAAVAVPFAPEFADLTDNMPLLAEVASITGGRILDGDPDRVNLFETAGTQLPVTSRPLTRPLMLVWLAVFLLDVAVRRLAVDVRAVGRGVAGWLRPRRGDARGEMLDRLQRTHERTRKQLSRRADSTEAARRLEAASQDRTEPPKTQAPVPQGPAPKEPDKPASAPEGGAVSHIEQLLRARRKAQDKD